ncbi:ThiF family adenylyltransferase [Desulfococcaceae bacterium HSG9]|nr:ThiF family adenylyltransferase [Desulfococcaceae bacterium HSG9]
MRSKFFHERLYRGDAFIKQMGQLRLTVCGAGAVGSHLVNNMVRQGIISLTVIDFDRVEQHNIGTQIYTENDIGLFKVEALQSEMFRAAGVEIKAVRQKLIERNIRKWLKNADLVVDGFDNHISRKIVTEYCREAAIDCLHVGLSADYAEIIWNENYIPPLDTDTEDVCDYPMARNLIQFAVALASEAIVRFVMAGRKEDYSFTLNDLKINWCHRR